MGKRIQVLHLLHSNDPRTGGVCAAVHLLNEALIEEGVASRISDRSQEQPGDPSTWLIGHGLWQWPGTRAEAIHRSYGNPYLIYPHGMLDPWFRRAHPFKHLKKQLYWWWRQERILRNAKAVCFTTEEERRLARSSFRPYRCQEAVTGIGASEAPVDKKGQLEAFYRRFPNLREKQKLLYLGRFHSKKGVDLLIDSWRRLGQGNDTALILAGPLECDSAQIRALRRLAQGDETIHWTGMLEGELKWGALRAADALVLPSHQENYGMVVAEACSVGLPVLLTRKVNLWREIEEGGAGFAEKDDQEGVDRMILRWKEGSLPNCASSARRCFEQSLHVSRAARKLIELMNKEAPCG